MSPLFGRGGGSHEPAHERTEAERERARQEREARRAAREGRGAPAPPPPETVSAPQPVSREVEPERAAEPAPTSPSHVEPAVPQPEPEPPAPSTEIHDALAWDGAEEPGHDFHDDLDEPYAEPAVTVLGRTEEPLGTKRVRASSMASAAGAEGPPRFGAPPRGIPRARHRRRRVLAALGLLVVIVGGWFLLSVFQPFKGDGSGSVHVRIPQGSSAKQIGDLLADKGVVSNGFFFALRARLSGKRGDLRSGDHVLKKGMSYGAAIDALTTTPAPPKMVRVVIPEGRSAREIVPSVKQAGLRGGYLKSTRDTSLLNPRRYGAPKGTKTLEGFLWPATYELKPGAPAAQLVREQIAAFKRNFKTVDLSYAKRKKLTRYDVLTIASMIEREALVPKDRRLIAAVIYNRLHQRMPIGIDATIRYALNDWSKPLTNTDLRVAGPYNTRTHTGLPPTPIGNPGLASIQAAANPAHVSYLFYVVKPCGNGAHAFSSTDAQFQKDVDAYNKARDARGGKDPSHC